MTRADLRVGGGPCAGGSCGNGVRCARHAACYARETMEKQGWVCITEYGATAKPATPEFLQMVEAVQVAGVEMQHWMAGWDDRRGIPLYGVWAPRVAAAILGTMQGRLSAAELARALQAAKLSTEFAEAVDAAWRLGGHDAAKGVIIEHLPNVADYINRARRR